MPYFHYTSRKAAQDIICGHPSRIRPGLSGKVYVSPTRYLSGCEAAGWLAIQNLVEVACEIPADWGVVLSQPSRARKIKGPGGVIIRRGRGIEMSTSSEIDVGGLRWVSLDEP
jgi:hypothetical protein